MKHLKIFENKSQELWIVVFVDLNDHENTTERLFDNLESAENFFIVFVNDIIKYSYSSSKRGQKIVTTVQEAEEWLGEYGSDYYAYYKSITIESEFKLPEKIFILRDTKKYNL